MLDGALMLWVNLLIVGITHPQSNKFVMGVKIKTTGDAKHNHSPDKSRMSFIQYNHVSKSSN